ncbi:MAG: HlyD family efflux transporter periplasmic adaptor subunit [Alphaproteobacteria bacterium]
MTRRKKLLIGSLVVVAAAAAALAYFEFGGANSEASGEIVLYGNVDIREVGLAFNVAGRVESVLVEEGEEVSKDQLLATLDASTYKAEAEAATAQTAAARATLNRLLAGSRPEEIREARANVQAIEADLEDARATLQRTEKLSIDKVVAKQRLDQDRARVKGLEAKLRAAQQRLSLVIQGPRKEEIAEARAQLHAKEAALALALQRMEYTKLFAKDRGVINTRVVEPGAVVSAQAPVFTMALTRPVWVRTYVSEAYLGRIRPGMKAEVFTDSRPKKPFEARVGYISPAAEFTPKSVETPELRTSLVYRMRVYVDKPGKALRQGMPVTVRLKLEAPKSQPAKTSSR